VLIPQPDKIQALLINAFSETERAEERSTTIEVVNASSNEAWTALASERMIFSGFEAISVRAEAEANAPTHLIDYGSASEQIGSDILSILGLSSSRLTKSPDSASTADFRLVIGEDYSPCFDPTRDQVDK
jgi:hypothetical protein